MKQPLRLLGILVVMFLSTAEVAAQQSCPAGYPATTPDSDFADVGNGTVRHIPTGLIWKRCAEGQTWNGSTCTGTADGYTWQQAFLRADAVNAGTQGWNAGQTDWRVPNQNELRSIVERGCFNPAINLTQFPVTPVSGFRSASPVAGSSDYEWGVEFVIGAHNQDYRDDVGQVRLVRAGQSFYNFDAAAAPPPTASATPVPTLSEWGMLFLSGLLGLMGWAGLRRSSFS